MPLPSGTSSVADPAFVLPPNGDRTEAAEQIAAAAAAVPVLRLHRDPDDLLDALAPEGRGLLLRGRAA